MLLTLNGTVNETDGVIWLAVGAVNVTGVTAAVGVAVGVFVGVAVGVLVGVTVGVFVGVAVGVGEPSGGNSSVIVVAVAAFPINGRP